MPSRSYRLPWQTSQTVSASSGPQTFVWQPMHPCNSTLSSPACVWNILLVSTKVIACLSLLVKKYHLLHLLVRIRDIGREIAFGLTNQATQVSTESVQEYLQRLAAAVGFPLYSTEQFENTFYFCQVVSRIFFFTCTSFSARSVRHHGSTRSPRTLRQRHDNARPSMPSSSPNIVTVWFSNWLVFLAHPGASFVLKFLKPTPGFVF